jgi:hypothetical protein
MIRSRWNRRAVAGGKSALLLAAATAVLAFVPTAAAAHAPGGLNCPLPVYNSTHWQLTIGQTVTCTIEGASDASGQSTVDVIIKSTTLGNTTVTGTVSGSGASTTITFQWTAGADRCDTNVVAYINTGNNTDNRFISPPGGSSAGFGYVDAQGNPVSCATPTAVKMLSFAANSARHGVHLSWKTASEAGTLGYNVYRQTSAGKVKLNSKLILAKGASNGAAYSFLARKSPTGAVRYLLQEVRTSGASRWLARTRIAS